MPPSSTTAIDEKKLWAAADELRANSKPRPAEYYLPVLGFIFLKYSADISRAMIDTMRPLRPATRCSGTCCPRPTPACRMRR